MLTLTDVQLKIFEHYCVFIMINQSDPYCFFPYVLLFVVIVTVYPLINEIMRELNKIFKPFILLNEPQIGK